MKPVKRIAIMFQSPKNRVLAGVLSKDPQGKFLFEYDDKFLKSSNAISLGPDLPLTQKRFVSEKLFPAFEDRLPERENPAYPDYCYQYGISPEEQDTFVLLSTLGKKGPSSFIFEAIYEPHPVTGQDVQHFRKSLHLNLREFSAVFHISLLTLQQMEHKALLSDREADSRIRLWMKYPDVTLKEIEHRLYLIHETKQAIVRRELLKASKNGSRSEHS